MKLLKRSLFLIAGLLVFSSCKKETVDAAVPEVKSVDTKEETDREKDEEKDWEKECFEWVFPVSFTMPDGTTVTGNNEEELDKLIKEWYEAHPDVKAEANLQYPIDIAFDDVVVTINNEEEMEGAEKRCKDDGDWGKEECFKLVFPVSFTMPDGTTITGNSGEELKQLMKEWYEAHPDVKAEADLQYPVDIVFDDVVVTINNEEEMEGAKRRCKEDKGGEKDCFEWVFPISFTMPDGTTITGNSGEELEKLVKEWYEAHPDVKEEADLQYPVDIVFEDGTTVTINNEEEMRGAKARCEDDKGGEYDCPDLEADIGDACRKDDGTEGTVNEDCECK